MNQDSAPESVPDPSSNLPPQDSGEASPSSKPVGLATLFAGVVLPLICFAISYPIRPEWQSGQPTAYAQLLLAHKESAPLYPFLLYCMTSMVLLFAAPARFRENAWVRFGIFSGVLVAAEYWLLFQVSLGTPNIPVVAFVSAIAAILPWGTWQFSGLLFGEHRPWILGGAIVLLLFLAGVTEAFPGVIVSFLCCSTPWALAAYVATSFRLIRGSETRFRFSLAQLLGFVSWFAAHCSAWRLSYVLMLQEYSRLPITPPERCFVCSAVAGGHRRVVRGEEYFAPSGTAYRVNDQLRVLKAFELLLASISPRGHLACRWIYDRLGPRLAAMLVHPLFADAAYFVLKPVEWAALACLRLAIPGKMELIYRLYSCGYNQFLPRTRKHRSRGKLYRRSIS